ncbi:hypothetical protein C3E98_036100 [Pseudomonas sp. MWU13-2625]|nr:hypothetical protein C3E98_036100 [Pseudomonas sp. MWU13-2625]
MSFFGNCGIRHGFVIERCDPSLAVRNLTSARRRGRPSIGPARKKQESRIVPRPFGVPPTEK